MQSVEIAVGLIRSAHQPNMWLGKFNRERVHFEFVTATRLEKESLRETVTREIAWELGMDRSKDFVVSNMAQLNCDFQNPLPGEEADSQIICSFYNIDLYRKNSLVHLQSRQDLQWLTSMELCSGKTETGIDICPLLLMLNEHAKVIQRWESTS